MSAGTTQQLRDRILTSPHVPIGVGGLLLKMVELIFAQQTEIDELRQTLLGHERRIADANRNISRLEGVHGA